MSDIVERLRAIDGYLNSLWDRAAKLRDQHTGQAHADLNDLRHGIGAIPDGLLEAADAITTLRDENERMRAAMTSALKRLEKGAPGWGVAKDELRAALKERVKP